MWYRKPLSFHIARHTFTTTVTLTNGVPIEAISKLLGYTSIKTTQIYAKVIEAKVSADMTLLRNKLNIHLESPQKQKFVAEVNVTTYLIERLPFILSASGIKS